MKVELFVPCVIDQFSPKTAENMKTLLEKLGCEVEYNPAQTCCGQPAFKAGFWKEGKEVAQKFLHDFSGQKYIVGASGSCVGMVKDHYGQLFFNAASHNKYRDVQVKIFEFSYFLVHILQKEVPGAEFPAKVAYMDACCALRECRIKDEPRRLLRHVKGLELIEVPDAEVCCGFGGTFSVKYPALSVEMARQKTEHAIKAGAEYLVSTDMSCLIHLQSYIDKQNLPLKTMHLADVLVKNA